MSDTSKYPLVASRWTHAPLPNRTPFAQPPANPSTDSPRSPNAHKPGNAIHTGPQEQPREVARYQAGLREQGYGERPNLAASNPYKQQPALNNPQTDATRRGPPQSMPSSQLQFTPSRFGTAKAPFHAGHSIGQPSLPRPNPTNQPGKQQTMQRQGSQGLSRAPVEPHAIRPVNSREGQGLASRKMPPDAPKQVSAIFSRPAQPVNGQGLQLKANIQPQAEQRQLSRAGEQLLMLVRLGDLKLPATVRKPKPAGQHCL